MGELRPSPVGPDEGGAPFREARESTSYEVDG